MLDAEQHCGDFHSQIPFSDKIQSIQKLIKYWKLMNKHKMPQLDREQLIQLNLDHNNTPKSNIQVHQQLTFNRVKLRQHVTNSHRLRDKFIQERVTAAAKQKNLKKSSAIKAILHCERVKRIFKHIKNALNKNHGPYLTSLMIPK